LLSQEDKLLGLDKAAGFYAVEVDSTGHIFARAVLPVPQDPVVTSGLLTICQGGNHLPQKIIDLQAHVLVLRQGILDQSSGIEWIGIVLGEGEILRKILCKSNLRDKGAAPSIIMAIINWACKLIGIWLSLSPVVVLCHYRIWLWLVVVVDMVDVTVTYTTALTLRTSDDWIGSTGTVNSIHCAVLDYGLLNGGISEAITGEANLVIRECVLRYYGIRIKNNNTYGIILYGALLYLGSGAIEIEANSMEIALKLIIQDFGGGLGLEITVDIIGGR